MNLRRLEKYLYKLYWKNGQVLKVDTDVVWNGKNCCVDIIEVYNHKFLFEIDNLVMFEDVDIDTTSFMYDRKWIKTFDAVKAACTPFYMDRVFTFKKFTPLTIDDLERCTEYFVKKILKTWHIWNIRVVTKEEPEKCETQKE